MYCKHCGKEIDDNAKFCTHCGEKKHKADIKESSEAIDNTTEEHIAPKNNIGKWSWGAFGLTWLYLNYMKDKSWWVFLLIMIITNGMIKSEDTTAVWIGVLGQFGEIINLGIKGRSIAWESREWQDLEHFRKTQKAWDIWGVVIFILYFFVGFISGS